MHGMPLGASTVYHGNTLDAAKKAHRYGNDPVKD